MKKKLNKRGISLIVLVITIIIMIILAAAIILSLNSSGIIERANKAKADSDIANKKQAAAVALAEYDLLVNSNDPSVANMDATTYVRNKLTAQGIDASDVTITESRDIIVISFAKTSTGVLAIGSEVRASNGEQFYVIGGDTVGTAISNSTEKVILLAKYNLKKEGNLITLKQDMTGNDNMCAFSSTYYWSSESGIVTPCTNGRDAGKQHPNLNDETTYPIGNATSVITIAKAYGTSLGVPGRLMTYEEALALEAKAFSVLYGFYKDGEYGLCYWLASPDEDFVHYVEGWYNMESINGNDYDSEVNAGVRPVIEISKSAIK